MSSKYFEDPDGRSLDAPSIGSAQNGVLPSASFGDDPYLIAKLSALDPAAQAESDLDSLRLKVEAVLEGKGVLVHQSSAGGSTGGDVDHLGELVPITALRTKRTAKKWAVVAAVAAGAVALSSGGYLAGVAQKDGATHSVSSTETEGPATADSPLGEGLVPAVPPRSGLDERLQYSANQLGSPGGNVHTDEPQDTSGRFGKAPLGGALPGSNEALAQKWQSGQYKFINGGLSTQSVTAQGWARDASGIYSKESVERLARDLDIKGVAKETDSTSWYVGAGNSASPTSFVQLDRSGRLSYNNFIESKGKAPSDDSAIKQAKALLQRIGLNGDDWQFEPHRYEGSSTYLWLQAYPIVGGQRLGDSWSFDFNANGITAADGPIAPAISLGNYDVVSPSEALARLSDSRFASKIWPNSYPVGVTTSWPTSDGAGYSISTDENGRQTAIVAPHEGAKLDWNVVTVTIDEAILGLSVYTNNDGSQLSLPTYELKAKGGGSWSVIAVSDSSLNM